MAKLDKVVLSSQQAAILSELHGSPRTTQWLQRACGVMAVGTRIHELRVIGFAIDTQLITVPSRHQRRAHVALYTLRRKRGRPGRVKTRARA